MKQEAADKGEATEGAEGEQFTDAEYVRVELRREEKKKAFEEYYKRAQAECEDHRRDERQVREARETDAPCFPWPIMTSFR